MSLNIPLLFSLGIPRIDSCHVVGQGPDWLRVRCQLHKEEKEEKEKEEGSGDPGDEISLK